MKRTLLIFHTALLLGCSPTPEPAHKASSASATAGSAAASKQITENQALELLMASLKQHRTADLDCLAFMAENNPPPVSKAERWEFAAHEVHNDRCGGDPAVSPVRDRYEVSALGKVRIYNAAEGDYTEF